MTTDLSTVVPVQRASSPASPTSLSSPRFRLHRAGIHNVWQYDEQEFAFGDGRLLLRGKNGAGKSKALEMLLPYLLDGDARALDATGTGRTSLVWLMLDGFEQTNRLGYLWVEFRRAAGEDDGDDRYLTLGAAIRASKSTNKAIPAFFVTPLRVGEDLQLVETGRPLPLEKLRERIGAANVTERAVEHRSRVARELFGITDTTRYRNLTQLLHRLRRPTVGDRIESGGLVTLLSETLPGLDEEIVERVARNLHDLDAVRNELGRLETTDKALRTFLVDYRGYLSGVLRKASGGVAAELTTLTERRRQAGDAAKEVSRLREEEKEADERLTTASDELDAARDDLDALQRSEGYRSVQELSERRATVEALHTAAAAAHAALLTAHTAEQGAAERLSGDLRQLAERLADLAAEHRDVRSDAEKAGVPATHLGEAVAPQYAELAGLRDIDLPDPDGTSQTVRHERVQAVDTAATGRSLDSWHGQLEAGQKVARNRARALADVQRLCEHAHSAGRKAADADSTRDQLERDLEAVTAQQAAASAHVAAESATYAQSVAAWAEQLTTLLAPEGPDLSPLLALTTPDTAPDDPLTRGSLPADIDVEAAQAAEALLAPHRERLAEQRDQAALIARQLHGDREELARQKAEWERQADPEPPPSRYRSADRRAGTGAPFYQLVDFAEALPDTERAGLEAALEASGLLDAWIGADGVVVDPHTRDVVLDPRAAPVEGPSLADVLWPVDVTGSGVTSERVHHLLASVALERAENTSASSVVHTDGSWRLGVLQGRHAKPAAEYVGAAVRAETRRRKLAELDAQITEAEQRLADARTQLSGLDAQRGTLEDARRLFPSSRKLSHAWAEAAARESAVRELAGRTSAASRAADEARTAAVAARTAAAAAASAHDLPTDPEALTRAATALAAVGSGLTRLAKSVQRTRTSLDGGQATHDAYARSHQLRLSRETDYRARLDELRPARRRLESLEAVVGTGEVEILARESAAKERIRTVKATLPQLRADASRAHEARVRYEETENGLRTQLTLQEGAVMAAGGALRQALGRHDVVRGAGLDVTALPDGGMDQAEADVRSRIRSLRALADAVTALLDRPTRDVSDSALMNRYTTLRDALAGGYDAQLVEQDGIKVCRLLDDHGSHDVAVVGERIAAQAADARNKLTQREREVFHKFLSGELGDHLSTQVIAAAGLVAALNATLATVRTSHGLGVELQWKLNEDADADVRAAVELLRSPSSLRTREQTEQLREVLQRRIEDARRAEPSAGYAAHLRTALDYREWFRFRTFVVEDARPGRKRPLTGRTGLSQGEQRVLSYLILFAAAASHFTTLGETAPHAPRLILLDDAFAKVDEPTHGRLGRILVDLDLDFVLTSERLMGNWAEVPSLHIYECLRDPRVRGVATLHYTWNGRHRRLVSV